MNALHPERLSGRAQALTPPDFEGFQNDQASWERALDFAAGIHASLPLLALVSRAPWFSSLPERVRYFIESRLRKERMVLALLDEECDAAFALLAHARIPVILLKGMDLGRRVYPERIFRPMTDVDFLVPEQAFDPAIRLLEQNGYMKVGPFPKGRFRIEMGRRPGLPVIELHRQLQTEQTETDLNAVWNRASAGLIPGVDPRILALHPEDQLTYLIRHSGVQHLVESPIWLNDLHFLIESPGFAAQAEWPSILTALEIKHSQSAALFLLGYLKRHFRTRIPDEVLSYLTENVGPVRSALISRRATPEECFPDRGRGLSWVATTRLLLRDRPQDAAAYVWRQLSGH